MKRSLAPRCVAAVVLATAALCAASAAQAHTDVYFSLALPGQPFEVQPAAVYVQRQPAYIQPRQVYLQPPVYIDERPWRSTYGFEFEREQAWQRAEWQRRVWQHRHHEWDRSPSHGRDRD